MPKGNEAQTLTANEAPTALVEALRTLEQKNAALRRDLWKSRQKPKGRIGYALLLVGFLTLIWSIVDVAYVPAFIGIALSFWGALLLFIRPGNYIKAALLSSTVHPTLEAINGLIESLHPRGKSLYLPPGTLNGSSREKLLIPLAEDTASARPVEVSNQPGFSEMLPKGICLTPSGQDLADLFEDELGTDFSEVDLDYVQKNLPGLFIEGLEIAEDFEMDRRENTLRTRVRNSIYRDLCSRIRKRSKSPCSAFACPLCSSIACTLTRVTGRPVRIQKSRVSADGGKLEVQFEILEE
jgi:hypothetical protein